MKVKYFTSAVAAVAISTCALATHANNGYDNAAGRNWTPPPQNNYWSAPDWSNFNFSSNRPPPRPAYNNANRQRPVAPRVSQRPPAYRPPAYRPPYPANNPAANRPNTYQPNMNRQAPANMAPPAPNVNRGYPPPRGPYTGNRSFVPNNSGSNFNMPGFNRFGNNNRNNNNKFWGRSGPGKWMNPNKNNMEQGWDDMINAPSRMGEMPGGWTAPEVSVPNPVDMGDQMQDNLKDLPEQIKNMDVGNDVK